MTESKSDENEPSERGKPSEGSATSGATEPSTNGSARLTDEEKDAWAEKKPGEEKEEKKDSSASESEKEASKEAAKEETKDKDKEVDLFPRGNRLNYKRALPTIFAGAVPAFFMMAKNGHNVWSIPVGLFFVLLTAFGVMDLLGTFDDPDEQVATSTTLGEIGMPLLRTVALGAAFCFALWAAQAAVLPTMASIVVV